MKKEQLRAINYEGRITGYCTIQATDNRQPVTGVINYD